MENTCFIESMNNISPAPVKQVESEKPEKKNILFDILNALFVNKDIVNNITAESARQNLFMINRRLAIKYPMQAQLFNISNVNPKEVIRSWSDFLYCGSIPKWIYTPGAAKTKSSSKNLINQDTVVKRFRSYYALGRRDMETCIRLFPAETEAELKEFVKFEKEIAKGNEEID